MNLLCKRKASYSGIVEAWELEWGHLKKRRWLWVLHTHKLHLPTKTISLSPWDIPALLTILKWPYLWWSNQNYSFLNICQFCCSLHIPSFIAPRKLARVRFLRGPAANIKLSSEKQSLSTKDCSNLIIYVGKNLESMYASILRVLDY